MNQLGSDNVTGTVIGEITPIKMTVLFGGREQGRATWHKSEHQAMKAGTERIKILKRSHEGICYDTGEAWEIRMAG